MSISVPLWMKSIVIEPYIFLMALTVKMSLIPLEQLQQDKICLIEFNQTIEYCLRMSESETSDVKLGILARSNTIGQYVAFIDAFPGIIWCLIVGSVCDRFPKTRKPFMISTVCSGLVRDSILLLNLTNFYNWGLNTLLVSAAIPTFVGSFWAGATLSFTYVATHSTKSDRMVRFLTAESSIYIAQASGNIISSQLLKRQSWLGGGEIRNYSATFILGIVSSLLCILWTIFRVEFKKTPIDVHTKDGSDVETIIYNNNEGEAELEDINCNGAKTENGKSIENDRDSKPKPETNFSKRFRLIKDILNPKHIISSFQACISKRDRPGLRIQIILLMVSHIAINLEKIGMSKIMFSFVQRLYRWNYETWSYVSVVGILLGPITTLIFIPFLAKVCKLVDMEIALVGVTSLILSTISQGSILSPVGLYVSMALSSLSNSASISIRSKMSKVIGKHEVTQIFSALTTIEVLCPFISAMLFTNIFNATMKYYPTLIMQISTITLFLPLISFIIIDLKLDENDCILIVY